MARVPNKPSDLTVKCYICSKVKPLDQMAYAGPAGIWVCQGGKHDQGA